MKIRNLVLQINFLLIALFALSCQNSNTNKQADTAKISSDTMASIWGLFSDTLPCADCGGIGTKLFLNKDFTYIKEEIYIGAPDTLQHIFYDLGKWSLKDSIIHLNDRVSGSNNQYKVLSNGNIQMMNENGQTMPDSIKNNYNLTYINKNFVPVKSFLVSGIINKSNAIMTLHICAWDKTEKLILSASLQKQLDTLWKNLKDPTATQAILQSEIITDAHNDNQIHATKLLGLIDGNSCN